MEELLSAQEIAEKRLPGVPTTKAAVHAMAKREAWYFEERTGVGGTRRVYQIPARYLPAKSKGAELHEMSGGRYRACDGGWSDPDEAKRLSRPGAAGAVTVEQDRDAYVTGKAGAPTAIAAGTKADPELLALAVQAVEEWCQESGKTLTPGRKGSVAAVLYDYLARGAGADDLRKFLRAVG